MRHGEAVLCADTGALTEKSLLIKSALSYAFAWKVERKFTRASDKPVPGVYFGSFACIV